MTMEDKKCPTFVDGEECGHPLIRVDLEAKKIAKYDLATDQCSLGHRSYILLEPQSKGWPSDIVCKEIVQEIDELTRKYTEARNPEIREEIYRLGRELDKRKNQ
jgi:hypothetical protein